jgi:hypothetical protein
MTKLTSEHFQRESTYLFSNFHLIFALNKQLTGRTMQLEDICAYRITFNTQSKLNETDVDLFPSCSE